MQKPLRTNPAYAHLAYRKTIVAHTKVLLRRKFLGDEVSGPRETLVCEEVFPIDARIPPEAIQEYIEGLSREEAELDESRAGSSIRSRRAPDLPRHRRRGGPGAPHARVCVRDVRRQDCAGGRRQPHAPSTTKPCAR